MDNGAKSPIRSKVSGSFDHSNSISPGMRVGDWVFLSGHTGVNSTETVVSSEFEPQVRQAFDNIQRTLSAADSSLVDIYHMTVWLTDMRLADEFLSIQSDVLGDTKVTTSLAGADGFVNTEERVKIEARAITSDSDLEKTVVDGPGLPAAEKLSSNHANCVTVGDLVYVSGQMGVDNEYNPVSIEFHPQMRRILENVRSSLKAAGSGTDDMATMTTWMTDHRDKPDFHNLRSEMLGTDVTTSTRIGVTDLYDVESFVQMEVVGVDSTVGKTMIDHPEELALATMERDGETYPRFWQCIQAGDWLFTAGMVGVDDEFKTVSPEFEPQTKKICENLEIALNAAEADIEDLVHTRTHLTDMRYAEEFFSLWDDFLGDVTATSTVIHSPLLAEKDFRIEIEAIARAPN